MDDFITFLIKYCKRVNNTFQALLNNVKMFKLNLKNTQAYLVKNNVCFTK